ncbi:MAG: sigma-54 dependent transcriptional regulator [Planctomycetota bacterium]|nr:sigma-54 dependent transcriptional regulator [Planctomycetota bacterium]
MAGSCETFRAFAQLLEQVAASEATVLLSGESGTGKGEAARALHELGPRASGPFLSVGLAALAPTLVESALFGHERGAFTGAHKDRPGFFRQAAGGTIVLDDIDLLPLEAQVKFLRVLQERVVEPLGAEESVPVDVRVIATTNRNLRAEVEAGRFREDLYFRLAVVLLEVPPLRARSGDLPLLVEHLMRRVAERFGVPARPVSDQAMARLEAHPWPGNVRELENAIERVLVLGDGEAVRVVELDFLDEAVAGVPEELARQALAGGLDVERMTRAMMELALAEERGNVSAAARRVGLTRRAFDYRMSRSGGVPGASGAPQEVDQA